MLIRTAEFAGLLDLPEAAQAPAGWLLVNLKGEDRAALLKLLGAVRRAEQRRESDRDTDTERRILVGPRLPRWMVDRYREAAQERGQSLYRWATEALEAHLYAQDEEDHYMDLMTQEDE